MLNSVHCTSTAPVVRAWSTPVNTKGRETKEKSCPPGRWRHLDRQQLLPRGKISNLTLRIEILCMYVGVCAVP